MPVLGVEGMHGSLAPHMGPSQNHQTGPYVPPDDHKGQRNSESDVRSLNSGSHDAHGK